MNDDKIYRSIWNRAKNIDSTRDLSVELIQNWLNEKSADYKSVKRRQIGTFTKIDCIVIELNDSKGCIPLVDYKDDIKWKSNNEARQQRSEIWSKAEWFEPLWIPQGRVNEILSDVKKHPESTMHERLNYHLSTTYTIPFLCVCVAQLMPKCSAFDDFIEIINESFICSFSGYKNSSLASLIPIVEGVLTRLLEGQPQSQLTLPARVDRAIDKAIDLAADIYYEEMWTPREYRDSSYLIALDERVYIFETFRSWMKEVFFSNTENYTGQSWLNRHAYAHALNNNWQQLSSFSLLIVALTTLGVIDSWGNRKSGITLFFEDMDSKGEKLLNEVMFTINMTLIKQEVQEKSDNTSLGGPEIFSKDWNFFIFISSFCLTLFMKLSSRKNKNTQ